MVLGNPRSFHHRFLFLLEVDGFLNAGFSKFGPLQADVAKVEHYEGGSLIPDKSAGRVSFPDITGERGATSDLDLYRWFLDTANIAANAGLIEPLYKRNCSLVQLARDRTVRRRWNVYNAFPVSFVAGDWDNDTDEVTIETVTLAYDYFELAL